MEQRVLVLVPALILALLTGFPPAADAFHEGGTGDCDGCHEQHPSEGDSGEPTGNGAPTAEPLLRGSDASSTCLRCHAEIEEQLDVLSGDGSCFNAGGDFYWLTRSYAWMEDGQPRTSAGDSHGHNAVAADYGLLPDGRLAAAPGGDYPAADLSCVSCHDPHGQQTGSSDDSFAGSYRLLAGRDYSAAGVTFSNDAPVALAPSYGSETDDNHVDYGSGMSEWCANCHGAMLDTSAAQHPAGHTAVFTERTAAAYGAYLRTGDFSGDAASSYLALVPFERGVADPGLLNPASTAGPESGSSNVMCLTCHRAHASAFESIGRWDLSAASLADSHPGPSDGGDAQNSYYGRDLAAELGPYQRSLCNKCHVRD
jgi:hypothetical protein